MNKYWQLRDALYRFFHNWPLLVACFLLGSLLGWLVGSLWPPYTKATRELYVALNPYRTYSDARFLALAKPRYANIDNYHYWQMNQLDALLYRDDLLETVQKSLQSHDAFWIEYTPAELRAMLDADWRTAGSWNLSALHPDRERAIELVTAWSEAAAAEVGESVAAGRELITIDEDLSAANTDLRSLETRQEALQQALKSLNAWSEAAAALPQDRSLPPKMRWQLYALTTSLAASNPTWAALLEAQPPPDAPAADFQTWVEAVLGVYEGELVLLPGQAQMMETRLEELKSAYEAVTEHSRGLSPNLEVQTMGEPQTLVVRPRSTLALIGGLLGIFTAALAALAAITRQNNTGEELNVAAGR